MPKIKAHFVRFLSIWYSKEFYPSLQKRTAFHLRLIPNSKFSICYPSSITQLGNTKCFACPCNFLIHQFSYSYVCTYWLFSSFSFFVELYSLQYGTTNGFLLFAFYARFHLWFILFRRLWHSGLHSNSKGSLAFIK